MRVGHSLQSRHDSVLVNVAEYELGAALASPDVQAVCLQPLPSLEWQKELVEAVEKEIFYIARTELTGLTVNAVAAWLEYNLPRDKVSRETRDALISDILNHFYLLETITSSTVFRMRILTALPNRMCGFHVDTVQPGMPTWGMLRVYNGEGTYWVDPSQVKSMQAFYTWLHARDLIVRRHNQLPATRDALLEQIDQFPNFLYQSAEINYIPSGNTIILRQLDASYHWNNHSPELAWIHCSPMSGKSRLIVNVSIGR